ncbi:hypothetical protein Poli38472_006092 [Pythium oligandrum]|uniref:Mif2/CENP-C cupin domain-containing protein n=1 Tax=Pythium oligandrum TaxID=41045 RepID=A0A8K1FPR0_PYTOL|nr:hypothetical protein Poli38472_006092 [Pythium oligandrum]|eukprot:TMW68624.1 hypothetical protein Poli38472_006092 [Pythium oligandrum]
MDSDELAELMPRTRAANERASVNVGNLRTYMAQSAASQRASVMIRNDVRKDDQGFDDIDDFWAENDGLDDDNDGTEGEESSILSEGVMSSANVSMMSNRSGVPDNDDFDFGAGNVSDSADTMDLESLPPQPTPASARRAKKLKEAALAEAQRSSRSAPTPEMDDSYEISFTPKKSSRGSSKAASNKELGSGSKAAQKKKMRRQSRDSFGSDVGGFNSNNSPFSINDAVLTPLSNASEKNLPSIKSFSESVSVNSPDIRVDLFKSKKTKSSKKSEKSDKSGKSDKSDKSGKSDKSDKGEKRSKPAKSKDTVRTPKTQTRKYTYKSSPVTDVSFENPADNDGSYMMTSMGGTDDDDSDWGDRHNDGSMVKRTRDGDLSYADAVLRDIDGDDVNGLRRSKRRRFKPLEWYKGEHYVYERRQSGVGLVIPTVAGIERVGSRSPTKKDRPKKRPTTTSRPKNQKPLPADKLPKDLVFENGEWADIWDNVAGCINKINVICRANEIDHRELPSVDSLPPGFAGQSFNIRSNVPFSRWICGRLGLPPGAAKEAESVGDAVQVFQVMDCQPQSLEVAFGPVTDDYFDLDNATRFLLNPKDEFYVPPQNAYYLRNHSETTTCELHFMILKPGSSKSAASSRESEGGSEQKRQKKH